MWKVRGTGYGACFRCVLSRCRCLFLRYLIAASCISSLVSFSLFFFLIVSAQSANGIYIYHRFNALLWSYFCSLALALHFFTERLINKALVYYCIFPVTFAQMKGLYSGVASRLALRQWRDLSTCQDVDWFKQASNLTGERDEIFRSPISSGHK